MLIRWTTPAAADLEHICDYTKSRFGAAQARRAALLLYDAANGLKDMPQRGRVGRKAGTRDFPLPGFRSSLSIA
jgi:plasmid stabilization system protein ParE